MSTSETGITVKSDSFKEKALRNATNKTTVYIASDSTAQTYPMDRAPQAGWGQFIAAYFTDEVRFSNRAIGGRSSKTFVTEGRLDDILSVIQPDDYLFIQMGHNDATLSRPERFTEPYNSYKEYLKMYLDGARLHKAIPVLITPMARLNYQDGMFINDFPDYCNAMKQLASNEKIPCIDLMAKSLNYYITVGYDEACTLFMVSVNGRDLTHFTVKGADRMARIIAEAVKELPVPLSGTVR